MRTKTWNAVKLNSLDRRPHCRTYSNTSLKTNRMTRRCERAGETAASSAERSNLGGRTALFYRYDIGPEIGKKVQCRRKNENGQSCPGRLIWVAVIFAASAWGPTRYR